MLRAERRRLVPGLGTPLRAGGAGRLERSPLTHVPHMSHRECGEKREITYFTDYTDHPCWWRPHMRHPGAPVQPLAAMPDADRATKRAAMMLARPRARELRKNQFSCRIHHRPARYRQYEGIPPGFINEQLLFQDKSHPRFCPID